ncbi:hypothetical protein ScPMuIL_001107 [Solemya velum]
MDETDTEIVENSNNESFKEREGKSGTVESVFSPLLRMMQWMACYTTYWNQEPSDRTTTTKFHFVACLIIIIYNWFDFFRYLTVFLGKSEASSYSMVSISFALFNATHAFSITTLFFAGSTYIRQLINRFLAYHSDHEEEFSVVFLRRLVILTLILASTTISTTAVVSITLTVIDYFTHDSVFGNLATPLTRGSPAAIAIVTVTSLTKICSSFSMVGLALFYGLSVFILFRDYRRLSWDFRDSCTNKTCILADDFNTLYSRHRKLTEILETANHLLEHFVFGAYGTAMPNVCFLLYGIIMGNLQMQDVVGLVQILILVTTGIVLVTWSGIKLSSKVCKQKISNYRSKASTGTNASFIPSRFTRHARDYSTADFNIYTSIGHLPAISKYVWDDGYKQVICTRDHRNPCDLCDRGLTAEANTH